MRLSLPFVLLALSIGAGAIALTRPRPSAPETRVEAELGGVRFSYRAAFARDGATRSGGVLDRLALIAVFPEFAPMAEGAAPVSTERDRKLIFVTLTPQDEAMEPSDRPARLYARFLESGASSGPGGLVMRRFERGSPYELEQLYVAPPDGRAFFARCPRRNVAGPLGPASCLWLFRWKSLDVELRFAPALLEHWDLLVDGARDFLRAVESPGSRR